MSETTIVLGAAIVRDFRLFVARRSQPPSMSGFWELPGDELATDERGTLEDLFASEFSVTLSAVDRILSDRALLSWRDAQDDSVDAALRIWRCQFGREATFDVEVGDPRPNMYRYDDSCWVPIDDLDVIGPWRDEARIAAGEVADYFLGDPVWQRAD
jgi:8-oxo-dGTP diphosphatase